MRYEAIPPMKIPKEQIRDYTTKKLPSETPDEVPGVTYVGPPISRVEVFVKNNLLANWTLADVPGLNDEFVVENITREYLPRCDAIIYVVSAKSGGLTNDVKKVNF